MSARCAIERSRDIDHTRHFRAVELNLVYNQVMCAGLASCAAAGLTHIVPWDKVEFFRHQLPDVLIADYRLRFSRPIYPRDLSARFEIHAVSMLPARQMVCPLTERTTSMLVTGTVLTYARAGVLMRRDSVVTVSDTAITMLRRELFPTARGGGLEIVRYERTTDGVRLVTPSDTLLLLRAGARVGEGWWSFNGPSRLVTARSIGAMATMAGTIQGAELVTRELGARGERRHTIWLSARYGVVRELTTDAASDGAAEGSLELIAVMRPDALTGRGAERR